MSACFDTAMRAWRRIRPLVQDEELAMRFEMLLESMHSANHKLDDGINKDRQVSRQARDLDDYLEQSQNRVCLKCGKKYEAQPGRVTGGLCPKC